MPYPTTPVISNFTAAESPLGAPWAATPLQGPNALLEATGGIAMPLPGGEYGSGSQLIPVVVNTPMELFYRRNAASAGFLYGFWGVRPGSENGVGALDGYAIFTGPGGTTIQVDRFVDNVETVILSVTGLTAVDNDQYGIRHESNGTITMFHNGVQVGSTVIDTTYLSGYMGLLLAGWGADDYGGGPMAQKLRPDADIVTTGWATAPLWSKVEEESAGGDVITATAS